MIKIKVNDHKEFEFSWNGDQLQIDNDTIEWDLIRLNEFQYHILTQGKSIEVLIQKRDLTNNTVTLQIEGHSYEITCQDRLSHLSSIIGASSEDASSNSIHAPMPGLIMDVCVEVGDEVSPTTTLLILEAMKMENAIKPTKPAMIRAIHVSKNQNVEKGELLIELADISAQ